MIVPSSSPLIWLNVEREARRVLLSFRDEQTGANVTVSVSLAAARTIAMAFRTVVNVRDSDPVDFACHGDLEIREKSA
jgi:hypothetical protein